MRTFQNFNLMDDPLIEFQKKITPNPANLHVPGIPRIHGLSSELANYQFFFFYQDEDNVGSGCQAGSMNGSEEPTKIVFCSVFCEMVD